MIEPTRGIAVDLVKLALDAASLNHAALADNIANANTPGFVRSHVSFEGQMDALRSALRQGEPVGRAALAHIAPVLRREAAGSAGGAAALDMDAAELAQNTLQYDALLKALGKHFAVLSTAINEGKR